MFNIIVFLLDAQVLSLLYFFKSISQNLSCFIKLFISYFIFTILSNFILLYSDYFNINYIMLFFQHIEYIHILLEFILILFYLVSETDKVVIKTNIIHSFIRDLIVTGCGHSRSWTGIISNTFIEIVATSCIIFLDSVILIDAVHFFDSFNFFDSNIFFDNSNSFDVINTNRFQLGSGFTSYKDPYVCKFVILILNYVDYLCSTAYLFIQVITECYLFLRCNIIQFNFHILA